MKHIIIKTDTEDEKLKYGTMLHNQLAGNPDYVHNEIVLNIDESCTVNLFVYDITHPVDLTLRFR